MSVLTQQLTIAEQQTRMLEIINETVAFYTEDPDRRAVDDGGTCTYFDDNTGKMCAVGRCLVDAEEVADNWGDAEDLLEGYGSYNTSGQSMFKPEYQGLPLKFWRDLQRWHDDDDVWSDAEGSPPSVPGYIKDECKEAGHAVQVAAQELRDNVDDGAYNRPD